MTDARFTSFHDFYPYYLSEHRHPFSRALHFMGTTVLLLLLIAWLMTQQMIFIVLMPFAGYGFAWLGHFVFEKNRPATFSHPVWSLMGDFVMYFQLLTRKIKFNEHRS